MSLYKVGGALPPDAPSYIWRQADQDLYEGLLAGEVYYVLNSRQMGKSSLRVQTMRRLQKAKVACAAIDITKIGHQGCTLEEWYAGVVFNLIKELQLPLSLSQFEAWWKAHQLLSPVNRFSEFIDGVLLKEIAGKIVIFIDEIDSILQVDFKDDFFAAIRAFYNKRAENPAYNRLSVALLGVATPADLISNQHSLPTYKTPFNVGHPVELHGFKFAEAQPLLQGLVEKASRPEAVLREIVFWTGGQPFLTQKLCKLVCESVPFIPEGTEAQQVEALVRSRIIENWAAQDHPEHLKTIGDRLILCSKQRTVGRLGLYQQILQDGSIPADDSLEQMELRLSGLVVKQENQLEVYNPIYTLVFNQNWVEEALAKLRPYEESFNAWVTSGCKDESRLLRGKALQNALSWREDKALSRLDQKFLADSQELDKREVERKLKLSAKRIIIIALVSLVFAVMIQQLLGQRTQNQIILARNLLNQAELIQQKDHLLQLSAAFTVGAMNQFDAVEAESILFNVLPLLPTSEISYTSDKRPLKHEGGVNQVTFSPKGTYWATASFDKTACLQVTSSTKQPKCITHNDSVTAVDFSPDERYLATSSLDGTVHILETASGRQFPELKCGRSVVTVAFSRYKEAQHLAAASSDDMACLWHNWNTASPKQVRLKHNTFVKAIAFSPDNKLLATASLDGTVYLWNPLTGQKLMGLNEKGGRAHSAGVNAIAFSADGGFLATADSNGVVHIWNSNGVEAVSPFIAHKDRVVAVAFSPDSKLLATASLDGTVGIWNVSNGKTVNAEWPKTVNAQWLNKPSENALEVKAIAFSLDSNYLATASSDNTARRWDIQSGKAVTIMTHEDIVTDVAFNPVNNSIATASLDGTARIWNITKDRPFMRLNHNQSIENLAFNANGKYLVTASKDRTVRIWDRANGKPQTVWMCDQVNSKLLSEKDGLHHDGPVTAIAFDKASKYLATVSDNRMVSVWSNWDTRPCQTRLPDDLGNINSIIFSPDGNYLAVATLEGTVQIWDRLHQKLLKEKQLQHQGPVTAVVFSSDGKSLATASRDDTAQVWRNWRTEGSHPEEPLKHDAFVEAVAFSPDGNYLATAGRNGIARLYYLEQKPRKVNELKHRGSLTKILFSPDGKYLATVSSDNTAHIWQDWKTSHRDWLNWRVNHQESRRKETITSVDFDNKGKFLAIASLDGTVCIREVKNDRQTCINTGEPVKVMDFTQDGNYLAVASDKTARVLLWKRRDLIKAACDRLTIKVTAEQWQQYLNDEPDFIRDQWNIPCSRNSFAQNLMLFVRNLISKIMFF